MNPDIYRWMTALLSGSSFTRDLYMHYGLWVKFTPPQGYTLTRKEFPALFSELDELSKRLQALKIHEVILDKSLNAAVV